MPPVNAPYHKPQGVLENGLSVARRLLQGAVSSTIAPAPLKPSPNFKDALKYGVDRLPSIAYQIPALIGAGQTMLEHGMGMKTPDTADRRQTQEAMARVTNADDNTRAYLTHVPVPRNAWEQAQEIGGSLLVPGPKGKAIAKSATFMEKLAGVAKEAALPLRQGKLGTTLATQVPIGLGINEAVDAATHNPDYHSIREAVSGTDDNHPQPTVRAMSRPVDDFIPPELHQDFAQAQASGDTATLEDILNIAAENQDEAAKNEELPPKPPWANPAAVVAGVTALGLGAVGARQAMKTLAGKKLAGLDTLGGQEYVGQLSNVGTKAKQGYIQADGAIRDHGKDVVSRDHYNQFLASLDSVTSPTLNTKTQHALTTGDIHGSGLVTQPVAHTLEAFAKEVDPNEWQVVTDGLLARSALDDVKRAGTQAAFNDKTPAELEAIAQRLENDPKLAKYAQRVKQHYRDIADYQLEQGMITPKTHAELVDARPNYVHMSRNKTYEDRTGLIFGKGAPDYETGRSVSSPQRSEEEMGGVQMGAASDPVRELPNQWAKSIREAEINKVKRDVLDKFANNAATSEHVKLVSVGEPPKSWENIHEVRVEGVPHYYKVTDKALDDALKFNPYATKSALATTLSIPKRIFENFTTGLGAPFFATKSAFYDTLTGIALRPKGYDLGAINEFKNRVIGQTNNPVLKAVGDTVGAISNKLDPTIWLSAPLGAVRLGWDEMLHSVSTDLSTRLLKENDWLKSAVGEQSLETWANRFAAAYDGSVKSLMDKHGATTTNYFQNSDPSGIGRQGLDVAPRFHSAVSEKAYQEALQGGASFYEGLLKGSSNSFEKLRASQIARTYVGLVRSLHEGFRYQAFATNLPKVIGDDELTQMMAMETRRLAGDIGQTGSSRLYQEVAGTVPYMNVTVQTLAQAGRQLKNQPVTTVSNIVGALATMTAMQYGWALSNPDNANILKESTDDENARQIRTFGNTTLAVPPELRLLWGPYSALLNEVTGINAGDPDPNVMSAIEQYLDGDKTMTEEGLFSIRQSFDSALQANNPLSIPPPIAAIANLSGLDTGMTKFTGKPQEVQGQKQSVTGGEGSLVDDAISARWQLAIENLMGTSVAHFMRAALDADRAYSDPGGSSEKAVEVAMSRMMDNTVKDSGPLKSMLFKDYESVQSVGDTNFKLFYKKDEGIKKAVATLNQEKENGATSGDPRYGMLKDTDFVEPQFQGTALMPIGAVTHDLNKQLTAARKQMSQLKDQVDAVKNQKFSSIEERNLSMNAWNEQRKALSELMLNATKQAEDTIRTAIGDPSFTYQSFDPKEYQGVPWPPPQAPGAVDPQQAPQ